MGLFKSQLSNVVEWEEYKDDCIFWKWTNKEIKNCLLYTSPSPRDA